MSRADGGALTSVAKQTGPDVACLRFATQSLGSFLNWAAVKAFKSSCYNAATPLFIIYPKYANLI